MIKAAKEWWNERTWQGKLIIGVIIALVIFGAFFGDSSVEPSV